MVDSRRTEMSARTCTCGGQFCVHCTAAPSADPFERSVDMALAAMHRAGLTVHRTPFEPLRLVAS